MTNWKEGSPPLGSASTSTGKPNKRGMQIKTYLVFLPNNVAKDGEPNRKVIAVKLTREAATRVRDAYPGAYVERHVADKL